MNMNILGNQNVFMNIMLLKLNIFQKKMNLSLLV